MPGPAVVKMGFNKSAKKVELQKCDEHAKDVTIPANGEQSCDMAIPGCHSQEDFSNNHYIEMDIVGGKTYYLWDHEWKVRYSESKKFDENAAAAPGDSNINEIKYLIIDANENFRFIRQNAISANYVKERYGCKEGIKWLEEVGLSLEDAFHVNNEVTRAHPEWGVWLCAQNINKKGWPSVDDLFALAKEFVGIVGNLYSADKLIASMNVLSDYKNSMDEKSLANSIVEICTDTVKIARFYGDIESQGKLYATARKKLSIGEIDYSSDIS